ncbi:MAG: iron-containing redox enzyme family protein [Azospirillaceae bacterium]|nr:iron-containing redox enzyme family protein [Azospirillaceae bacterium]
MTLSFYQHLVLETALDQARFRAIPLILRAVTLGVDRDLYLAFLANAYHHVRHTCPLMGLALSHCREDDAAYRAGLLDYVMEEKGHEAWILEDIAALGGDPRHVVERTAPFAVRMMVAYAYFAVERISPYTLLGMIHVLEGMSVALAPAAADAIRAHLTPDDGTDGARDAIPPGFRYLTTHGQLDENHVDLFAGLLERIDTPARRGLVVQAARDFYRLYGDVFRTLSPAREIRDAA